MVRKPLPDEALVALRERFELRSTTRAERKQLIQETATLYGVSTATVYRALRTRAHARPLRRIDYGVPRILPPAELERYCELIAALKVRMRNTKGRHLSTPEAIRLFEGYGIDAPEGRVVAPKSLLKKSTANQYLHKWGYEQRMLAVQQPVVHFQASYANECWQFDEELGGQEVILWWGLFDDELPVEREGRKYGPYRPVSGLIPEALNARPAEIRAFLRGRLASGRIQELPQELIKLGIVA
jgi:hypothetical protein